MMIMRISSGSSATSSDLNDVILAGEESPHEGKSPFTLWSRVSASERAPLLPLEVSKSSSHSLRLKIKIIMCNVKE